MSLMFPWDPYKNLPDASKHTEEWLKATDVISKRRFDTTKPLEQDFSRDQAPSEFAAMMSKEVLREILDARRMICSSQFRLSRMVAEIITEEAFEEQWTSMDEKKRLDIILGAFRNQESQGGATSLSTFGPEKLNCPEVSRDALLKNGGRGYLELAKQFLLDNNDDVPTKPFILVHPHFDKLIGYDPDDTETARKSWLDARRLMRTYYIGNVVFGIIAKYKGHELTLVPTTHEHYKTKETLDKMRPVFDHILGPTAGKAYLKEQAKLRKEMKLFCDHCLKPEDKAQGGKMSACARCKAVDREVRYCNKDCQKAAWKMHKKQCGKDLELSSILQDVEPDTRGQYIAQLRPDIPPASTGYKRSPFLLRLIRHLNDERSKDYILYQATKNPKDPEIYSVSLDETVGASVFCVMRNRAMCTGEESAILYIYRVLQNRDRSGTAHEHLRKQMKDEYEGAWDNVWAELCAGRLPKVRQVNRAEIEEAMTQLHKLKRFPELEFFKPGQGKAETRGVAVGPEKDVIVMVEFPTLSTGILSRFMAAKKPTASTRCSKGPNSVFPAPTPREGNIRYPGLETQFSYLKANSDSDYIIMDGTTQYPKTPYAIQLSDVTDCLGFIHFRQRLFANGGYDMDALVYVYMTLDQALRQKKVSKTVLIKQLEREFGQEYVIRAVNSVDKDDMFTRFNGDVVSREGITTRSDDLNTVITSVADSDRFPMLRLILNMKK